ncbi:MAG TPA: hypothetical protein VGM23_09050, partial [Armatimonadota bacterium]
MRQNSLPCLLMLGFVLLAGTVPVIAGGSNLLLANQSRLERPAITAAQYTPIGGARLELSTQQPLEGKSSLRVAAGQAQPDSPYGASTTVGVRERNYWYEKKEYNYLTSQFEAGFYTVSMYVRGDGPLTLGFTTDDGTSSSMECPVSATDWQRISLTVKAPVVFHEATISITSKKFSATNAFFVDQVQWEPGAAATTY